jgi:hypothetical protein
LNDIIEKTKNRQKNNHIIGKNIDSYEKINNILKRLIDKTVYGKINRNIIDAIENDTINNLNKNLKVLHYAMLF